jgi:hypothetical protein
VVVVVVVVLVVTIFFTDHVAELVQIFESLPLLIYAIFLTKLKITIRRSSYRSLKLCGKTF